MRRIYESGALHRDDDEPFSPREDDRSHRPQAMRSVNGGALSRLLAPAWLRHRAISVDVSTPQRTYPAGTSVPFTVTMTNSLPVSITIRTRSPLLWTWDVDGVTEASNVALRDPPDERGEFTFRRGERKAFRRRWPGSFRVSDSTWEPADPGEYAIGAGLNVAAPSEKGLYGETSVRIVPD